MLEAADREADGVVVERGRAGDHEERLEMRARQVMVDYPDPLERAIAVLAAAKVLSG